MPGETVEARYADPLLFRHATPRTPSSTHLPGRYDDGAQLWVVDTPSGTVPAIQAAGSALLETSTSTRVRQEGDDEDRSGAVVWGATELAGTTLTAVQMEADDQDASTDVRCLDTLLDTSTVTKVRQEGSDDDLTSDETIAPRRRLDRLAELATKTDVQQESDDEVNAAALELETRSLNNHESVDDDFPAMLLELQTPAFADVQGEDDRSLIH